MVAGPGKIPENQPIQRFITPEAQVKAPRQEKSRPSDQVTLSPRAVQAQALAAKVEATPEVRADKVAEARAQAAAQAPLAPAAKVAEKLLTES